MLRHDETNLSDILENLNAILFSLKEDKITLMNTQNCKGKTHLPANSK